LPLRAIELGDLHHGVTLSGAVVTEEFEMRPYSLSFLTSRPGLNTNPSISHHSFLIHTGWSLFSVGAKFVEARKFCASFEDTAILTLRGPEEHGRQITSAAKAFVTKKLQATFEDGSKLIKRGIIFCSSLYLYNFESLSI
jgi:hypothetical protein